ncbi:phosphatase PAP2 family protein [soil metagenome]
MSTDVIAAAPLASGRGRLVEQRWRYVRWTVGAAYVVLLVWYCITEGVPVERLRVTAWIFAALAIWCLGRGWRTAARAVLDWVPFTAVLYAYDLTRGVADTVGMPVHVSAPAVADQVLFFGELPPVWLQQQFYTPGQVRWYDVAVSLIYITHFLATPLVAAVLWVRHRQQWIAYSTRVVVLALAGLVTYVLYPAAPPWYAARDGVIEPVSRISNIGWNELGLTKAAALIDTGQATANLVAAIPSLHTAFAALIAAFFFRRARGWLRVLLVVYPLAMALVLVYSGEHYVVDVLLGWFYFVGVLVAVPAASRWWLRRRGVPADSART